MKKVALNPSLVSEIQRYYQKKKKHRNQTTMYVKCR